MIMKKNTLDEFDYTGIDLQKWSYFRYKHDFSEVVFKYPDNIALPNVTEISQVEYESFVVQYEKEVQDLQASLPPIPPTTEQKVEILENTLLKSADDKYKSLDKESSDVEVFRAAKIEQLKEQCTQAIYEGFLSNTFVGKSFGFNDKDQANFSQVYLTVVSGDNAGATIKWKSKQGIVEMTEEQFRSVILESKDHKMSQQTKYWTLEAQVLAATTNAEIDAMVW